MMGEWDDERGHLVINRGVTVLADDLGRVLDKLPTPTNNSGCHKHASNQRRPLTTSACVAPRHGQDVVVDPAGNAFSVRVHLAQHLHLTQRVAKLEAMVADLQGQVGTHQRLMHDIRRENFVTQGAFMAAQLCKADKGTVKSHHGKLDLVCELLISAGIFEEATGGGLCVREKEEEIKPCAAVEPAHAGIGRTAFLEESLTHAEEAIARIDRSVEAASVEAKRTAAVAVGANSRLDKVAARCGLVEERCTRTDERCQQVDEYCTAAVEENRNRLDESLEETRELIETNSTRIFHLAAEVEGLVSASKASPAAARRLALAREETGDIFSVEVADFPPEQQEGHGRTTATPPKATVGKRKDKIRERLKPSVSRAKKDPGETPNLSTLAEGENHHVPCRPGVLDEPGSSPGEDSAKTRGVESNPQHPAPPSAQRRCNSTFSGRRAVVMSPEIKDPPVGLIAGPVRPPEYHAAPGVWSRASSWPLLSNAAATHGGGGGTDTGTGEEKKGMILRRDYSMPNLGLTSRTHDGPPDATRIKLAGTAPAIDLVSAGAVGDVRLHPHVATAIADRIEGSDTAGTSRGDEENAREALPRDNSPMKAPNHHVGEACGTGNKDRQPPVPSQALAAMTAQEVAEALGIAAVAQGRPHDTAAAAKATDDSLDGGLSGRLTSPGTRLACLGNPLHDLGANEELSSDDASSTTAADGR
ncbi:unnamed protein product [Ectocarpus sp. 6 AP-2014]